MVDILKSAYHGLISRLVCALFEVLKITKIAFQKDEYHLAYKPDSMVKTSAIDDSVCSLI